MATLRKVIQGLQEGHSFRRSVDMLGGSERLVPIGNSLVSHEVILLVHKPLTKDERPRRAMPGVEVYRMETKTELSIAEIEVSSAFVGNWRQE
jgi:hypothetical protein